MSDPSNVLDLVDPRWHNEFSTYVETGEASQDFFSYLESNSRAREAVEQVFASQSAAFERLAQRLGAGHER